jgi:hypothetical protein
MRDTPLYIITAQLPILQPDVQDPQTMGSAAAGPLISNIIYSSANITAWPQPRNILGMNSSAKIRAIPQHRNNFNINTYHDTTMIALNIPDPASCSNVNSASNTPINTQPCLS